MKPSGVVHSSRAFSGQREEEQVLLRVRKHPVFLALSLVLPGLLLCGSVAGLLFILVRSTNAGWSFSPLGWVALVGLGGALLWGGLAYLEWGNDQMLVTTQRIVVMRRVFRLFEERQEAEITKVQDIVITFPSLLASTLDYGDIDLATASAISRLRFPGVGQPQLVKETIFHQREEALEAERQSRRQDFEERLRERLGTQT